MLLVIIITLVAVGAVIVMALYSSIVPFFAVIGNTANYNIAYYGAIASTERALLSLKNHEPGYEGQGGFSGSAAYGNVITDIITGGFGRLTDTSNTKMTRTIRSLTDAIPGSGLGDVEVLLQGTGSSSFNQLGYEKLVEIPLYRDTATGAAQTYTTGILTSITAANGITLRGTLRLPPKVIESFGGAGIYKLDDQTDIDGDGIKDDVVVSRGLKGTNISNGLSFSIIPIINVDYNQQLPLYEFENSIRETHINNVSNQNGTNTPNLFMNDSPYRFNPILQPFILGASGVTGHNAIPANALIINAETGFNYILNDPLLSELSLSLNLVNKLTSPISQIFPFLEYQLKVCENGAPLCNVPVSDRYFRIDAVGKVGEYEVHIKLKKSVLKKDATSDFTIIF